MYSRKREPVTIGNLFDAKRLRMGCGVVVKKCNGRDSFRIVEWVNNGNYKEIRKGTVEYADKNAIMQAFTNNSLYCEHFFEWRHVDTKVSRLDKLEPKYIALFKLQDGRYMIPQAKFYKQAYRNSGRTDSTKRDSLLESGCPYWCCLYNLRVANEQNSKKKYQRRHQRGADE